ncbi:probable ATP-dependent RNA helicase DDX10 [Copidosoma floridanum]|uniref:probable ATP-dependent RNA helicase DDX10 n=1 Tax=Copidosoma floridanum TaxID=29053 RepID=UPI0006C99EE4|nr:probable ATP-dependent RNA helicase DDX10 [Copidosoma floridanum]
MKKKIVAFKKKKKMPSSEVISQLEARYKNIDPTKIEKFSDLPLSKYTLKGLSENSYSKMTDIQRQSIHLAMQKHDVLAAARTGSGKTLAFLVPILERLYCKQWTHLDGLGALIITPTRELAYQIAEELKSVGKFHNFTIGLIIGGKNPGDEMERLRNCNIVVATPGRLLFHMETNYNFETLTMQIVVLDEADRILDMGFKEAMDNIIGYLPPERQTLLFSATQTKSVKDLARLSLKDPFYVSVHEHAATATPEGLQQSYIVCELEEKVAVLYSFLCNHRKQKIIVFFSTCNQVSFMYEAFCHLRPGISILATSGKRSQLRRTDTYRSFHNKSFAALFCTDVAERGLDFPKIDWVVQMDCPADVDSYIHRSGRTARLNNSGESLLVLLPSELAMVEQLRNKKIPINKIQVNPSKLHSPVKKLEALLVRRIEIKEAAQRAVVSYIKNVSLMKDKSVFKVHALNIAAFSKSFGLAIPPRVRYLERQIKKQNEPSENETSLNKDKKEISNGHESESSETKQSCISSQKKSNFRNNDDFNFDDDDDDDDLLTVKKKITNESSSDDDLPEEDLEAALKSKNKKAITKASIAKKLLKKNIKTNKKTVFDEEGQEQIDPTKSKVSEIGRQYEEKEEGGIDINLAKQILQEEDKYDKLLYKEKMKKKKQEIKRKLKAQQKTEEGKSSKVKEYNASDSESEADDDDGYEEPDLSWLPDPDVIYGKEKGSDGDSGKEDESSEEDSNDDSEPDDEKRSKHKQKNKSDSSELDSDEEHVHRPMKRKLIVADNIGKKKRKQQDFHEAENENLQADEELALQLLRQ